ncbi:MAG: hypothetical protein L3J06_03695 [Cyclobacteriaceae bacterium]|nr:hypothetical protein [Cyclobacteriaceae bacterium]
MVKKLIIVLFFFAPFITTAQVEESKSKIKLTDGSEFYAVIKENDPGKHIKIALSGNKEATIKYSTILYIKHKDYSYFSKYIQSKGFYIEGSTSLLFGKTTEQGDVRTGAALGVTVNYQLNAHLSVGLGVEPTIIRIANQQLLMPTYGRLKYSMLERRVTPVLIVDAGWAFALTKKEEDFRTISYNGGWYIKPSVGIQSGKFTLSVGYQLQKLTSTINENNWWGNNNVTVEERIMKNISLNGSLRF